MRNIYLDNSATTKCLDSVTMRMMKVLQEDYGNPSSMHRKGLEAEHYIRDGKEKIARTLKVDSKEIIFTSGGTESINLAIIGSAMANIRSGKHLITTKIEHPSVLNTMHHLEEQGFTVTYLDVDANGIIDLNQLMESVTKETILVSILHVNNEIGALQPIQDASDVIKQKNENALLHIDAIQSYGKYEIYPKRMGVDLLSVSGHKIHGPKGVGFLYKKDKTKMKPILFGGGQQKNLRSGTENVPGIAGLSEASSFVYENLNKNTKYLYQLRELFIDQIKNLEFAVINGKTDRNSAPHIVSVSFEQVKSEVLLHALENKGIYVSAGSACASNHHIISQTLKQIGIENKYLDTTLRFSFSIFNTMEDICDCIQALKELVPMLQKYQRH